jgi:energy-coupling factor transporter ATP-binding protein EcfA2
MIQLSSAGKRFGPKLLFEDLDWMIGAKERVGLVGANGTGKSTLLKILGGIESLDYGQLTVMKGLTAGYLPQDGLTVFANVREIEREMEELTHRMPELDSRQSRIRTGCRSLSPSRLRVPGPRRLHHRDPGSRRCSITTWTCRPAGQLTVISTTAAGKLASTCSSDCFSKPQ